ncbi:hypothetical protein BDF14DRAFT_1731500 [Spinellus fusiger]|nr:hypothetical protein BDF14DRAFT_1731500 [Spinellus fusiger]
MVVTRYSLEYLSEVYRDGHYSAPDTLSDTHSASETQNERQMFVAEISALHLMYEKMLYTDLPFPRAGQVSTQVLDYVDQLASDIELISGSYYEIKGLIEALDRAAQRTFNSPRITRHIFNGLVKLGEYEEAENALRAYMYLVGLTSQAWVENRVCGEALVTNAKGYYVPVPTLDMEEEEGLASRRTVEHEPPEVIIGVLLKAVRMYCKDLGSGREAVELADMALKRWHRAEMAEYENGELKGQVYRAIGVAYSLLASQTNDPSLRPTYHEKAVQYLVQSIKIDANAWESYYQLALQQAEMREIRQAVQSISQSLQLNPGHIASWQLLTLACSSPVQNDIRQAVRTCEMGLKESQPTDRYSETEQAILLQITQSLLLNATQGPAVALQSQRKVFESYSKIAVSEQSQNSSTSSYQDTSSHGIVVSGSLGNLSEVQFVAENKRRNRSGSNVSSIGSMLDQKTDTLSNSFLADRARSTSSMNARPDRSLSVVNESENEPKSFHTHHGLHLFGSRSSSRRSRKEIPENLWTDKSQGSKLSLSDIRSGHLVSGSTQSLQSPTLSITSGRSIFHASSMPNKSTTRSRHRIQRSQRILSNLWLLSASLYLEQNNLEEARKAIEEAEHVEWTTNPHVWCMLGRLRLAEQNSELAMEAFEKGLVADPADVECKVWLAKIHKENEELEIAEGLLDSVTKGNGWDCSEAWFLLGEIYRETGRLEQTKACFFYALDLETTRPIQPFSILPRHV